MVLIRDAWPDDILDPGEDRDAASYVDDTSVDRRLTGGFGIWVNAQVLRDARREWFYELLKHAPDTSGELKSEDLLQVYSDMHVASRRVVDVGLRKVRVHVTDTRTYATAVRRICDQYGGVGYRQVRLAPSDDGANRLLWKIQVLEDQAIAHAVLQDSAQHRLRRRLGDVPRLTPAVIGIRDLKPDQLAEADVESDLIALAREGKGAAERAAEFAAMSSPVFTLAADRLDNASTAELWNLRYAAGRASLHRAAREGLSEGHVYDKGDESMIERIETHRCAILRGLDDGLGFGPESGLKPIDTTDSRKSWRVQAADFAAGYAKLKYVRGGPHGLVRCFDYVTLNGRRIGETEANEFVRKYPEVFRSP